MTGPDTIYPERGYPTDAPAASLIEAGFALEVADAPLLHHGLNLADIAHVLVLLEQQVIPRDAARRLLRLLLRVHGMPAEEADDTGLADVLDPGAIVATRTLAGGAAPDVVRGMTRGCAAAAAQIREQATGAATGLAAAEDAPLTMAREIAANESAGTRAWTARPAPGQSRQQEEGRR